MLAAGEEHDAQRASKFSLASDIVELVVLTADEAFLATLREGVGSAIRLWHVPSPDKVSDLLLAGDVGILVLDGAMLGGASAEFIGQLKRQFPELVILHAGTREDEADLAGLISRGAVYRFIHKPMSSARARLFVQAAIRKYEDPRTTQVITTPRKPAAVQRSWWLGAAVAAVLLTVAAAMTWRSKHTQPDTSAAIASLSAAADPLLLHAAEALAANRLTEPRGDNALEYYLAKLARTPNDPTARTGLAEVHERLLARAENALLEERLEEADAAIDSARRAGVESGRIAFLTAQLNKAREQSKLAQTRARAQSEQRASSDKLSQALQSAAERMDQGRLLEPETDSALFHVKQADIDAGRAALVAARGEVQTESRDKLLRLASERLQQDRLLEPANDCAKYYLISLRALDPAFAGLAPALQDFGGRLMVKARRASSLAQYEAAKTWLDEANAAGYPINEITALRAEIDAASHAQVAASGIVGAGALTLLKSVQPDYPAEAARKKIEGWVDLEFTVKTDGGVSDASIRSAQPVGVFDQAAIKAVYKWRFKPVLRDNRPIEQRARIRVRFALNP